MIFAWFWRCKIGIHQHRFDLQYPPCWPSKFWSLIWVPKNSVVVKSLHPAVFIASTRWHMLQWWERTQMKHPPSFIIFIIICFFFLSLLLFFFFFFGSSMQVFFRSRKIGHSAVLMYSFGKYEHSKRPGISVMMGTSETKRELKVHRSVLVSYSNHSFITQYFFWGGSLTMEQQAK